MRENGRLWQFKDLTIRLAEAYGYCWGVERAVQMAYEARRQFPNHKVHVTNEIIHNPAVNQVRPCPCLGHSFHRSVQLMAAASWYLQARGVAVCCFCALKSVSAADFCKVWVAS